MNIKATSIYTLKDLIKIRFIYVTQIKLKVITKR